MVVLVGVETLLLVLLTALVLGLLRSNAAILRRLEERELGAGAHPASWQDATQAPERGVESAPAIAGVTPRGDALKILLGAGGPSTLIAFLSSGCSTCASFWEGFAADPGAGALPASLRRVIVCKGVEAEQPARLAELAPPNVPVILSSEAWDAYSVQGSPYFVLVDGASGLIAGEGTAAAWSQLTSLVRDAGRDHGHFETDESRERVPSRDRSQVVDAVLSANGIGPGHASLYPASGTQAPHAPRAED
jgi:hypothetical protein